MGGNYLLFDVAYCPKLQKKHYFKQIYADTIQLGEIIHKIPCSCVLLHKIHYSRMTIKSKWLSGKFMKVFSVSFLFEKENEEWKTYFRIPSSWIINGSFKCGFWNFYMLKRWTSLWWKFSSEANTGELYFSHFHKD